MNPEFVRLPDNRRLAFAEYGDPEGLPVVYCHGFPSSRQEASLLHRAAEQDGYRIIAADRPGFGDSDFKAYRQIDDWPDDVTALADHLGLRSFGLLGVSGGAPFALACAARIGSRLSGCTLVCPLGPVYESWALQAMRWTVRINFEAALYTPAFVRALYGGVTSSVLYHWPHLVESLARDVATTPADRQALSDPEVRAVLTETIREAMRNHGQGALQDLDLYVHPWGFDCADIELPITVWHGEEDAMVPIAHAHWYAQTLPHAQARFLSSEGHYSLLLFHTADILQSLLAGR